MPESKPLLPIIYVSTDVETDGPIPGVHSMLSIGSAAFDENGRLLDTFYANIEELPGAVRDEKTMRFWDRNKEAWENCHEDKRPPYVAMLHYHQWIKSLPGRPVFVGYPAAWDFMFVLWYLIKYIGNSPFSHSALDIKTLASAVSGIRYDKCTKKRMPKRWFDKSVKHTHNALDDAIEQGGLFFRILGDLKELRERADACIAQLTEVY